MGCHLNVFICFLLNDSSSFVFPLDIRTVTWGCSEIRGIVFLKHFPLFKKDNIEIQRAIIGIALFNLIMKYIVLLPLNYFEIFTDPDQYKNFLENSKHFFNCVF